MEEVLMDAVDIEIAQEDQKAYKNLAEYIVNDNKRLAWEIVHMWLEKHNNLLIEKS